MNRCRRCARNDTFEIRFIALTYTHIHTQLHTYAHTYKRIRRGIIRSHRFLSRCRENEKLKGRVNDMRACRVVSTGTIPRFPLPPSLPFPISPRVNHPAFSSRTRRARPLRAPVSIYFSPFAGQIAAFIAKLTKRARAKYIGRC